MKEHLERIHSAGVSATMALNNLVAAAISQEGGLWKDKLLDAQRQLDAASKEITRAIAAG
jgi:hypothetical protein